MELRDRSLSKLTTIIITIIGIVGSIVTIYAFLFQEKHVGLQFEIVANTNVLDIKADITKLDISYDGTSLKQNRENLRIINIRVVNTGNESILKTFYDDKDPLGFSISSGRIIERPQVLETSSAYLKQNLSVDLDSLGRVAFSSVILEPKEYFVVKALVLHSTEVEPVISSRGKIAGIKSIEMVNAAEPKNDKPFFTEVFYGSMLVQAVRAFGYAIGVVISIVIVVFVADKLSTWRAKKKRGHLIDKFKAAKDYTYSKMDDAIFDRYQEEGITALLSMMSLLKDEKELNSSYDKSLQRLKKSEVEAPVFYGGGELIEIDHMVPRVEYRRNYEWIVIKNMLQDGIIIKEKDILVINQSMKNSLGKLITFLEENGEKGHGVTANRDGRIMTS